jgi:uncharacterized protein YeaO (DUF488 family)
MIRAERVYEFSKDSSNNDEGRTFTILVDRLWPRGLSKEDVKMDLWLKDIAPSDKLRKWFAHDPAKWDDFKKKYKKEILEDDKKVELLKKIKQTERERGSVLLLFSAKDKEHNNAVALLEMINEI